MPRLTYTIQRHFCPQQVRALQPRRQAGSLRSHQLAGTLGTLRDAPGTLRNASSSLGTLREGWGLGQGTSPAGTLRGTQRESGSLLGTLREGRSPGECASPTGSLQGSGVGTQQGGGSPAEEGLAGAGVQEEEACGDVGTGTLQGNAGGPGWPGAPLSAPAGDRIRAPAVVRSSCVKTLQAPAPLHQLPKLGRKETCIHTLAQDTGLALRKVALILHLLSLHVSKVPSSSH